MKSAVPNLHTLRSHYRDAILAIAAAHNAAEVRVFGSVARGNAGPDSDLDLLIRSGPGCSLLDVCAMENEISDMLDGMKVDVLTESGVRDELAPFIFREAVPL